MTLDDLRHFLLYCSWINIAFLVIWLLMVLFARDWIYKIHSQWFPMSREKFEIIHYCGIGLFKLLIFVFVIIPYFALALQGQFG